MAITEDRVDQTATLADLLGRVEALEAQQDASIQKKNKMTIIAWGGNLDRIWPTTILATTAAASGMEASVFFTFWGLFAIVKPGVRITGDNWMQKMMSVMNPGSAQKAKLSHYQFLGAGPAMFKKLADNNNVAKPDELIALRTRPRRPADPLPDDDGPARPQARGPARRARGADRGRHRHPRDARGGHPAVHLRPATRARCSAAHSRSTGSAMRAAAPRDQRGPVAPRAIDRRIPPMQTVARYGSRSSAGCAWAPGPAHRRCRRSRRARGVSSSPPASRTSCPRRRLDRARAPPP